MAEQDRSKPKRAANAEELAINSRAQTTSRRKPSSYLTSRNTPDQPREPTGNSTVVDASQLSSPARGVQQVGANKTVIGADQFASPSRVIIYNQKRGAFESVVAGPSELTESQPAKKQRTDVKFFQSKLPVTPKKNPQNSNNPVQSESLVVTEVPAGLRLAGVDKKNQERLTDTSSNHHSHENIPSSKNDKPGVGSRYRSDDESFAIFLKVWVFPVIKEVGTSFKKNFHVGDDEFVPIIKGVETDIAQDRLKKIAKNNGYVLNGEQRGRLKVSIKDEFKKRIPHLSNLHVGGKERRSDSHSIAKNRLDSRRASSLLNSPGQHEHGETSPDVLGFGPDPVLQPKISAYNAGISNASYGGSAQMPSKEKLERKRYQDHENTPIADITSDEDGEKELAKWTSIPKKADHQSDHLNTKQNIATSPRSVVDQTHRRSLPNAPQAIPSSRQSHPKSNPPRDKTSLRSRTTSRFPKKSYPMANSLAAEQSGAKKLPSTDNPHLEYLAATLAISTTNIYRPYRIEKRDTPLDTANALQHVDFSDEECGALLKAIRGMVVGRDLPVRTVLKSLTEDNTYEENTSLIDCVHADPDSILQNRKRRGIRAFLSDLANDRASDRPSFTMIEVKTVVPRRKDFRSMSSLLLSRQLGYSTAPGIHRNTMDEMRLRIADNLQPWSSWKGASGDVVACAWAPNSLTFAAAAAAPSNNEDLQYNRPRNLLLGDLMRNVLYELPDHRIARPHPSTIPSGPNSLQDMYNNLDPMIYMTVSSLQFSRDGSRLFTASHDKTAKIWDVPSTGAATCLRTMRYDNVVTDLAVSQHHDGLFATASKSIQNPIKVYSAESWDSEDSLFSSLEFSSARAQKKPEWELYPECLRWGRTPTTSQLLLVGFQQWGQVEADGCGREGEVCLWDLQAGQSLHVAPAKTNVFCATWHPVFDLFAVGGAPGRINLSHPQTTKSVVRVWDIRGLRRYAAEYECPALDMQDITFNPLMPNLVTAGCTDSATYVWDFRKPDEVYLKLQHGSPLATLDPTRRQEEVDPGVMMTVWGLQGSRLYTGSSDGVVKCWDTNRSPEDAFVGDVADFGAEVQSGAFSPDFTHLLVGDADGAIHVLTSAPVGNWPEYGSDDKCPVQPIRFIDAPNARAPTNNEDDQGQEGILAAKELLKSEQLVLNKKYGVGKGPNYAGPYARYARNEGDNSNFARLLPEFDVMQPFSRNGHKRREHASRIKGIISARKQLIAEAKPLNPSSIGSNIDLDGEVDEQHPSRERTLHSDGIAPSTSKRIRSESSPSTSEMVQSETEMVQSEIDIIDIDSDANKEAVEDIEELAEELVEALVEDAIEEDVEGSVEYEEF